jgi:hypothetical protein
MIKMQNYNPFLHGNPVPPEHFRGRKSELRRIVGRIANAGSFLTWISVLWPY